MSVFIDTWGFKAFIDRLEPDHIEVKALLEDLWENGEEVVTSDYILDETITLISVRLPFDKVKEFIKYAEQAYQEGYIKLLWIREEYFDDAKKFRLKYNDKPRISFTDFTTMAVMKRRNITRIITKDRHFEEAGMGFEVLF